MTRFYEHNTSLFHEDSTSVHSDKEAYLSAMRRRIEQMQKNKEILYINNIDQNLSDDEIYRQIADACNQFVKIADAESEKNLADILEKYNLQLYCYSFNSVSSDKCAVARMAFNGYVDRPQEYQLSESFRRIKNVFSARVSAKPEDYDLSYSSGWNQFKKVPEFAAIEDKVKKGLSEYGVPPEKLAELKLKDFCFIINEQFRGNHNLKAKVFSESYKAKNTIRFINEYENEFRAGLLSMKNVREDYVEALIKAMKKGCTDLSKSPDFKPEWKNQPVIDVHHIVNIKDVNSLENSGKDFMHINDYENMCFIVRYPQHDAMHALEQDLANVNEQGQPIYHNDIFNNYEVDKKMIYRIQPPDGARCMLGFNSVIYDKNYLGLQNDEVTNLPDTAKKTKIFKEASLNREHKNPYNYRNSPYSKHHNIKNMRREANKTIKEVLNARNNI